MLHIYSAINFVKKVVNIALAGLGIGTTPMRVLDPPHRDESFLHEFF